MYVILRLVNYKHIAGEQWLTKLERWAANWQGCVQDTLLLQSEVRSHHTLQLLPNEQFKSG